MQQAVRAPGNISATSRQINGVHHTLSVWRDREAMRKYLVARTHLKAMKLFPKIATGKTIGFQSHSIPDWSEVHAIWQERGKEL
ncbi:MAG: hypothetical protein AAF217_10560 [Pseudomonadota bacterium]